MSGQHGIPLGRDFELKIKGYIEEYVKEHFESELPFCAIGIIPIIDYISKETRKMDEARGLVEDLCPTIKRYAVLDNPEEDEQKKFVEKYLELPIFHIESNNLHI